MAKTRRKKGGCTGGRFKRKRMGKGWSTHRIVRGHPKPVDRSKEDESKESEKSAAASSSSEG